jgi:uncharacterized MnhB-related membrane protein
MFRLRASDVMTVISGTVAGVVVGFTISFSYLLLQIAGVAISGGIFGAGAMVMPYLTIEGAFIAAVLVGAYKALHRRN